jgi:hypothetical protein
MSQERWDVILRFVDGPLSFQGTVTCRGPVVRIGANPGPGDLKLSGYRGLDDRHAVITCYDGGAVSIGSVGENPVRVGPHEFTEWSELQPIRKPVFLAEGNAVHLGPLERGATFVFTEAQRLGVWQQRQIISDAAQASPDLQPSEVQTIDAQKGVPPWFVPAIIIMFLFTTTAVMVRYFDDWFAGAPDPLGVTLEGADYVASVDISEPIEAHLIEGLNAPFSEFVMRPNAEAARWPQLGSDPALWDKRFLEYTTRAFKTYGRMRAFWKRLEAIKSDYGFVVRQLRTKRLPEVFAGIPYQESRYRAKIESIACAEGWWQFIPEAAHRANIEVRDCRFKGTNKFWSPTRLVPVINVMKNAPYIVQTKKGGRCRIDTCKIDERQDLAISTRGALFSLGEAYDDRLFKDSGAVVQLSILSHNAGYDNSRFEERRVNRINMLPAYRRFLKKNQVSRAPDFYGANITCTNLKQEDYASISNQCGGVLWNHTQHYGYNIVAQHLLAVCYYAKNYSSENAFSPWRKWARSDQYCEKLIEVPTREEVSKW